MDKKDKIIYEELNYGIKRINSWYKKNFKSLSIITMPFNSSLIFRDIIIDLVKKNEKVLYIWNGDGELKELIESLKGIKKNITCGYKEDDTNNYDIRFINYKSISGIKERYKLAIFDDITHHSFLGENMLKNEYEYTFEIAEKSILYTIEPVVTVGEQFELATIFKRTPFVEPRIMTTRIDLNRDIPYILYDYLNWFRNEKKRVVIFVPNKDKLDIVYDYYVDKLKMDGVRIIKYLKSDEKKYINNSLKIRDKAIFIITDYMEVSLEDSKIEDAVVLFADSNRYNYKKFIYLCGSIGLVNIKSPEVLFVSRDISNEMDRAKEMARDFNKRLWERSFINY